MNNSKNIFSKTFQDKGQDKGPTSAGETKEPPARGISETKTEKTKKKNIELHFETSPKKRREKKVAKKRCFGQKRCSRRSDEDVDGTDPSKQL